MDSPANHKICGLNSSLKVLTRWIIFPDKFL